MATAVSQRNKIHPHKFTLWVGIGSIVMMFAGLTSAYIVKRNQAGWVGYELPLAFWYENQNASCRNNEDDSSSS